MEISDMHTGLCRICIQKEGKWQLAERISDKPIKDVIEKLFGIMLSTNKNYSESICNDCFSFVANSYQFRNRIQKSEESWKHYSELLEKEDHYEIIYELKVEPIDSEIESFEFGPETITPNYNQSKNVSSNTKKIAKAIISLNKKRYRCKVCGTTCASAFALHQHRQTHNTYGPKCDICNKSFTSKLNLKTHMNTHAPDADRTINCEKCDKKYRTKTAYQMHYKQHMGIKDISCAVCQRLFYHRRDLMRHMKTLHLEIKNYGCQLCDKKFSNSGNLYTHMRVHTGEKPYKCKYCDCKFNQSSPLHKHLEKHVLNGDSVKNGNQRNTIEK